MEIKRYTLQMVIILLLSALTYSTFAQDDTKPWERLGLSVAEWKLIKDNDLPMKKVEELLMAGIGIHEYFEQPWQKCNLEEDEWISLRRSGLTSSDIEMQQQAKSESLKKNRQPAENSFEEYDVTRENKKLFTSLFLPGYLQLKDERKPRGRVMIGVGVGAIAGTVAFSIAKKQFISLPLFAILIPDMVWSLVDQKKYAKKNN